MIDINVYMTHATDQPSFKFMGPKELISYGLAQKEGGTRQADFIILILISL